MKNNSQNMCHNICFVSFLYLPRILTKLERKDVSYTSRSKSGGGGKSGGGRGKSGGGGKSGGKSGGAGKVPGRTVTVQPGRSQCNPVRSSDVGRAQRLGQGVHGKAVLQVPKHTTVPSSVKQDAANASVQIKRK